MMVSQEAPLTDFSAADPAMLFHPHALPAPGRQAFDPLTAFMSICSLACQRFFLPLHGFTGGSLYPWKFLQVIGRVMIRQLLYDGQKI